MSGIVEEFRGIILEKNPSQATILSQSISMLTSGEKSTLSNYIEYSLAKMDSLEKVADAYLTIVKDTFREQLFFQRHGRYRYSTFSEVSESVYYNHDYMRNYMYGLALTSYLWPNHLRMKRYFEESIQGIGGDKYLEIGPGHGLFFITAMQKKSFQSYLGLDLSPTSARMTREIVQSGRFGKFDNYDVIVQDFLEWEEECLFDAVIMGEVMEHVEDPVALLKGIDRGATDDAFIFVTTCIDSPAVDHITHYASMDEIATHVHESGLGIKDQLLVPYGDLSLEESQEERLPITVAMILEKQNG